MVRCAIHITKNKKKPEWLSTLLNTEFFGSCAIHRDIRKNEQNMFCIDCKLCCCKHCITSSVHCFHRWIQICRYVYQDVIRLQDMQKVYECSRIQSYKINGEKAVHLHPRRIFKKGTPKIGGSSCKACRRHLQDPPSHFCSITCKDSSENPEDQNNEMEIESFVQTTEEEKDSSLILAEKFHKRKGIPRRAPFC